MAVDYLAVNSVTTALEPRVLALKLSDHEQRHNSPTNALRHSFFSKDPKLNSFLITTIVIFCNNNDKIVDECGGFIIDKDNHANENGGMQEAISKSQHDIMNTVNLGGSLVE